MRPRYKQIKDPILLTTAKLYNNHILCFFCVWGTLANKFLVIYSIKQTGCCKIVLIKKQIDDSHGNFTRDSTFFAIKSVTMFLPIVSLGVKTRSSIFLHPFLVKTPPSPKLLQNYKYLKCEISRILLKHVSDHLSVLFQFV